MRADKDRLEREFAAEQERFKREVERLQADLAAAQAKTLELGRGSGEVEDLRQRLAGLQADQARTQTEFAQEREVRLQEVARLKADLAAEREARRAEVERCQADQAATAAMRGEFAKKVDEAAELKGRLLAAQGAVSKAEEAQRAERERGEQALVAERESRRVEVERLRAEVAAGLVVKQEKERLLQDLAAEKTRAAAAQSAGEKAETALSGLRGSSERAIAAEREESRRLEALSAARVATLETQLKTQAEALQAREAELAEARAREGSLVARHAKGQADLELLAERQVALEARAAGESLTLAECERGRDKARRAVSELALELGRTALRAQYWEKARGYLEQAAEADPRGGEAWYGLGEVYFQLGQYEKSKQMYERAKQIY